ncbi:hypothetical protein AAAX74_06930, partial [Phocaeicola vulgatus]
KPDMLRLAFDFIITWRETRTRPNAYINLTEENFNLDRPRKQFVKQIERQKYQQQTKPTSRFSGKGKLRDAGGGSHSEKREWEVGQKGSYDDVDDGNSIRR